MLGGHAEVGEVPVGALDHSSLPVDPGHSGPEQRRFRQQGAGAQERVEDPVPGGDAG